MDLRDGSKVELRPFAAPEWHLYRALRLRALADSPDAFARTLQEEEGRGDEQWARRLSEMCASPDWFSQVAFRRSEAMGFAFARIAAGHARDAQLYSMWVDPRARQIGIGHLIVHAAIAWARRNEAARMLLQVAETNLPATRLYIDAGFELTGDTEPLRAGSSLTARTMVLHL